MTTNIIAFPTATKTAFTDAEQAALTACAESLRGDITAQFENDDRGFQNCWFAPPYLGANAVAGVRIENGEMTLTGGHEDGMWGHRLEDILTTRDIRVIVAAIVDHWES